MSDFFQSPPQLTNTYKQDRWLKAYLRYKLPPELFSEVDRDLENLGRLCAGPYLELARRAEREKPVHVPYDPWGQRLDEIRVSSAWVELQNISAREGMIAIGYERKHAELSRLYQFAKLYLFHPSSAFFTCPLAMADGAARLLETYGDQPVHREAFAHLTTRDPSRFWTSGQWMTERTGGSDVSGTSTDVRFDGAQARLYGTKWFSSATTSQMALALGRLPDSPTGSRGLTLFWVPTYLAPNRLNHIQILRLKDKLGTWALPTAELKLEGTLATQVGEKDQGVKTVATMLNITRLYNSVCSIGQAGRALMLLRDYSGKREVFKQPLKDHVLHTLTFADEELKTLAGFLLTMEMVHLLGKEECKTATDVDADILRLMTPVTKLFTARAAIQTASEVVEGFGGAGYIEDTGIPVHLRDAQVFPIWEGATNVLSLDVIRVVQKSSALESLKADWTARLKRIPQAERVKGEIERFEKELKIWLKAAPEVQVGSSRSLAFYLGRMHALLLLLEWAASAPAPQQASLQPWIELYFRRYLGQWSPIVAEDAAASQTIFQAGPLET